MEEELLHIHHNRYGNRRLGLAPRAIQYEPLYPSRYYTHTSSVARSRHREQYGSYYEMLIEASRPLVFSAPGQQPEVAQFGCSFRWEPLGQPCDATSARYGGNLPALLSSRNEVYALEKQPLLCLRAAHPVKHTQSEAALHRQMCDVQYHQRVPIHRRLLEGDCGISCHST